MFRWIALGVLLSAMSISASFRIRARRATGTIARSSEPPLMIVLRLLVALPLVGSILAYLINPDWMEWASISLAEPIRWMGVVVGVCAVPMLYWVFVSIGSNVSETVLTKTDHQLVSHGPYRWIRHPLYSVAVALIFSIGLMGANWFVLALGFIVLIAILLIVIPAEEAALLAMFEDEYASLMERTGRILPLLFDRR